MYNFTPAPCVCVCLHVGGGWKEIKALKMIFSARMWEPPFTLGRPKFHGGLMPPPPTAIRPLLIALPHYCPTFMTLLHPLIPPSLSLCFPYFATIPTWPYRGNPGACCLFLSKAGSVFGCNTMRKRADFRRIRGISARSPQLKFPPPRHSGRMAFRTAPAARAR